MFTGENVLKIRVLIDVLKVRDIFLLFKKSFLISYIVIF